MDIRKSLLTTFLLKRSLGAVKLDGAIAPRSWRASDGQRAKSTTWRQRFKGGSMRLPSSGWRLTFAAMLGRLASDQLVYSAGGREACAPRYGEFDSGDPAADIMFACPFASVSQKAGSATQEETFVARDLAPRRAVGRSADQSEEIHIEPPAYMDDFFLPVYQRHSC